jgi:hypothetical protein
VRECGGPKESRTRPDAATVRRRLTSAARRLRGGSRAASVGGPGALGALRPPAQNAVDTAVARRLRGVAPVVALAAVAWLIFWLSGRDMPWPPRRDLFDLADAFLHGRTWLDYQPDGWDVIVRGDRAYVPFSPLPAVLLMPLVAVLGADGALALRPTIHALLAAACVALTWALAGRLGVRAVTDRLWLCLLVGCSTALWWVSQRGGPWHTGQLLGAALTFGCLVELAGRRRAWLIGVLGGAAFLARAPMALAIPVYGAWLAVVGRGSEGTAAAPRIRVGSAVVMLACAAPALIFFLGYNAVRFGSPFESGYGMATLPGFLEQRRQLGLFGLVHLPMNLELLLAHLPALIPEFPWIKPDAFGLSILLTSPGLLLALRAPFRRTDARLLAVGFVLTLVPSLLYYGGGWKQYGYRYALDAIPFAIALCALAAAKDGRIALPVKVAIVFGVLVNLVGVYWAFRI